jgi:hypothetical protein
MLRPLAIRLVRRSVARRLRRLGGTDTLAWALRVPLVTLVVVALVVVGGRRPR